MKRKVAVMVLVMCMTLTGCSSGEPDDLMKEKKETVVSMYNNLKSQYNGLSTAYANLQDQMNKLYEDKELNPGVTVVGDGSGALTLHSVNDMLQFNEALTYPGAVAMESSSSISITKDVDVVARDNWTTKLYNSTLELEHSSGISANISVEYATEYLTDGNMKDSVLTPWIQSVTQEPVEYSDVFINNDVLGYQGKCNVLVDETKNYIMTCGIAGSNGVAVTYVFLYEGDKDDVKDELIKSIVESITISDQQLKLS